MAVEIRNPFVPLMHRRPVGAISLSPESSVPKTQWLYAGPLERTGTRMEGIIPRIYEDTIYTYDEDISSRSLVGPLQDVLRTIKDPHTERILGHEVLMQPRLQSDGLFSREPNGVVALYNTLRAQTDWVVNQYFFSLRVHTGNSGYLDQDAVHPEFYITLGGYTYPRLNTELRMEGVPPMLQIQHKAVVDAVTHTEHINFKKLILDERVHLGKGGRVVAYACCDYDRNVLLHPEKIRNIDLEHYDPSHMRKLFDPYLYIVAV